MTVELLLTLLLAIPGSVAAALGCTLWMLAGAVVLLGTGMLGVATLPLIAASRPRIPALPA